MSNDKQPSDAIEKAISKTLQHYIDSANSSFETSKHYVVLAYEQARKDGYSPQEAKQLLLEKITAFSDRTIYRYLPDEAKDQKAVELANSKKNAPSLTSGNDILDSKQLEVIQEVTKAAEGSYEYEEIKRKLDDDIEKAQRKLLKQKNRDELNAEKPVIELEPAVVTETGIGTDNYWTSKFKDEERRKEEIHRKEKRFRLVCDDPFEYVEREIPDNSIDLEYADPTHSYSNKELLELDIYGKLAQSAQRILKEGAPLFVLVPHELLPEAANKLALSLTYHWIICVPFIEPRIISDIGINKKIINEYKILIHFIKGNINEVSSLGGYLTDYIEESASQPQKYLIKYRTAGDNSVVLDRFMGVGKTGKVATERHMLRQFIGIERNIEKFEIAKRRIGKGIEGDLDEFWTKRDKVTQSIVSEGPTR